MPREGTSSVTWPTVKPSLVAPLPMLAAAEKYPFRIAAEHAAMAALVHFGIIGEQKARRADRPHGLLAQPRFRSGAPLNCSAVTCCTLSSTAERLDHEHLDFGDEQVRENHDVRRTVDHDLARLLRRHRRLSSARHSPAAFRPWCQTSSWAGRACETRAAGRFRCGRCRSRARPPSTSPPYSVPIALSATLKIEECTKAG